MKAFLKYGVLLRLAVIYLAQRVDAPRHTLKVIGLERVVSNEKEALEQLAMLTAQNGNALPVNTVHDGVNVHPNFRYLPRNSFLAQVEEHNKVIQPYFKYVENYYRDSFASRQDVGYYVFALREIIV